MYSLLQGKSALPCKQGWNGLTLFNKPQAIYSCDKDPFDRITKSTVKDDA